MTYNKERGKDKEGWVDRIAARKQARAHQILLRFTSQVFITPNFACRPSYIHTELLFRKCVTENTSWTGCIGTIQEKRTWIRSHSTSLDTSVCRNGSPKYTYPYKPQNLPDQLSWWPKCLPDGRATVLCRTMHYSTTICKHLHLHHSCVHVQHSPAPELPLGPQVNLRPLLYVYVVHPHLIGLNICSLWQLSTH